MASIIWTVGAQDDLRGIVEYIGRDSTVYAADVAGRIVSAVERLCRHPKLGRVVPEYEDETIRELIVGNYRVVYRLRRQRVGIVAIVHGSRDLLRRFSGEPWDFG
ncbi:MAG TPA: type II toxin-antitoxin system RelE/ParE family toxin [Alphaproteobacteria bacterium]|nr:type II toxin-antitoxin system RelE/ParE family toxin [Alphaproteobacteria bacterium]